MNNTITIQLHKDSQQRDLYIYGIPADKLTYSLLSSVVLIHVFFVVCVCKFLVKLVKYEWEGDL